jgi:peptide/nickel transport system substrate-binding protein
VIFERNPYYWKIDTEGNQLPYADRIIMRVIPDLETLRLRFINGELDFLGHASHLSAFGVLKRRERFGIYQVHLSGLGPGPVFYLNWKTPRLELRKAIRDRRVRIALSHAINREEVNHALYHGLLEPCGYSFRRPCPYFSEESYLRYSSYEPERARRLLEEAGYTDSDGDGVREFADGSPFTLTLNVARGWGYADISLFVAEYWAEIGIKAYLNIALTEILYPRYATGDWDVATATMEATVDPMGRPHFWMIIGSSHPFWHHDGDEDAPEWLREATRYLTLALETRDTEKAYALMAKVRDIHSEEVPAISVGSLPMVWGSHNRLGNVPDATAVDDIFLGWDRSVFLEQVFVR